MPRAKLKCEIVYAKPYLKSLVAEACIQTKRASSCSALHAYAEAHIALKVVEVPLLPAIEDLSSIRESRQLDGGRTEPAILSAHQGRVVAVKPAVAKAAQRVRPAQSRLKIKRNLLAVPGVR